MEIKVTSSISSKVLKHTLFRGCWIAFLGVALLLFGGTFVSLSFLQHFGFFLFLASIALITIGLLPYRKYTQMQLNPAVLIRNETSIAYYFKGKKILTIPMKSGSEWNYVNDPLRYGILLSVQNENAGPILVHQKISLVEKMRKEGRRNGGILFFPFFSLTTYRELFDENENENEDGVQKK
jgi:hypothetical protein